MEICFGTQLSNFGAKIVRVRSHVADSTRVNVPSNLILRGGVVKISSAKRFSDKISGCSYSLYNREGLGPYGVQVVVMATPVAPITSCRPALLGPVR